jgi:AraC-like DNA-binding protein
MQIRVDRDARAIDGARFAKLPELVIPLDTTIVTLRVGDRTERLARAAMALLPPRTAYELELPPGGTAVLVTLGIEERERAAIAREYRPHVDPRALRDVLGAVRVLPRTRWVDELVHRYVFERDTCEKHASKAARFLETELTKEVYFLGHEQAAQRTRASVVFEGDSIAARAKAWLEEHLFEPFHGSDLARAMHASESTVLRVVRKELGVAPAVYQRRRRLEEAMLLLESGRYGVTEVATRVGYDNPSAFAAAFRRELGVAPSSVKPTVDAATRLPAHGAPPVRPRRRRRRD